MKSTRSFVLGAVLVAALIGGSDVTWASTNSQRPAGHAAPAQAKPLDASTPGASNYVPITPCREVDTRYAALVPGPTAAGTTREVDFTGKASELVDQGGQYGCLIPYNATAIQVSITATGPPVRAAWSPGHSTVHSPERRC